MCLRLAVIVLERTKQWIRAIEIPCAREGARSVAREIMPEGSDASRTIVGGSNCRISADDGIGQGNGATEVPDAAAIVSRGIAGNRRVRDTYGTKPVEDTAAVKRGIPADGAIGDDYRRVGAIDAAAAPYRAVTAHGATRQGERARAENTSAASTRVETEQDIVADGRVNQ